MEPEPPAEFEALLLLLGRLTYSWTNTESLLIHVIAGLAGVDVETALVIFLTLNTTRARVDLVERLAKLERVPEARRDPILQATAELLRLSAIRNRYNHAIYAFDFEHHTARTIQMRIADRRDAIRMGRSTPLDAAERRNVEQALADLAELNRRIWGLIRQFRFPV